MKIQINLYATLALQKTNRGTEADIMEIEDGTSIGDILNRLGISRDVPKIIFLNGVHADLETIPKDGDRIAVFPPIAGG
jgi:molybdopterin synthase sulfur carrier subunit